MFTIRPFQSTEADYEAMVTIHNVNWQDNLLIVEGEKRADARRNPDHFFRRLVGELSDEVIAIGECAETYWLEEPDQYHWHYDFLPDFANRGYEEQMYDQLLALIAPRNPWKFSVGMRDDKVEQIQFIEARGYRLIQIDPTSILDVTAFDSELFRDVTNKVEQLGIQMASIRFSAASKMRSVSSS